MLQLTKFATVTALGLFLLTTVGCNKPAADPAVIAAHQTRLLLTEEPEGVQTVADVRAMLLGGHDDHDHDGDGHQDHDAADHDDHAHADHDDHDHDGDGHQDHDAADHDEHAHSDHDEHDHDGDGHQDHDAEDHDAEHHDDHGHAHDDHDDHDHDGDGHQDHAAEDHDDHSDHDHSGHDHGDHAEHAHETETQEVTVVGHIGGGLANPWAATMTEYPIATSEAVLFLADPEAVIDNEASGHKHAPGEECVFCAQNAPSNSDKLAMVQFVDANGKVLKFGLQKLFDVKENDMVVIRGQAKVTAKGYLVINATGLYLRN